jgi:nitrite reductase/ring-hydroxylating ferredoxin subunit
MDIPSINFTCLRKNGRRSFAIRQPEVTRKKLSLFSTIAQDRLEVVHPETGETVALEALTPLGAPYIVQERAAEEEEEEAGFVKVCSVEEFHRQKKQNKINGIRVNVRGRDVLILQQKERFFALDAVCYHYGGPLLGGEIEDLPNGRSCVVCPWHRYKIDLETGRSLHGTSIKGGVWTESETQMQRTHLVQIENNQILVKLDRSPQDIPSDHYAVMGLLDL